MDGGRTLLSQKKVRYIPGMSEETSVAVRVWDLPVRLFHWILALLFVAQVVTGKIGGALMTWHAWMGYTILTLVIFRILWGFAGGVHARFASFMAGPAATLRFASLLFSRRPSPYIGHNPLGGWSAAAMIALLAAQAIAGLFANDGLAFDGPFARMVSIDTSNRFARFHDWNAIALFILAGLHVAAVLFHWLVKKEDLVGAMFTGVKRVPHEIAGPASRNGASHPWRAMALLVLAATAVALLIYGVPR
jgi:cytochrome b